mgnify:CR=1 FL=1
MTVPLSPANPIYRIQGKDVTLPCIVRDAASANASFLVPSRAARELFPGPELDVVELLPGRTLLSLACIDYRDNDLGDYNEISIAFFVRERSAPRGLPWLGAAVDLMRGRLPTWIHRLPVNQSFTCEAGSRIWGFPKTVDEIEIEERGDRVDCRWAKDGRKVMALSLPRGGTRSMPQQSMQTYTWLEGALHRTAFVSQSEEVGFRREALFYVWEGHGHRV